MKTGDTVKIYEMPYTAEVLEGEAKLIRFIRENEGMQLWEVEFPDGDIVGRWI